MAPRRCWSTHKNPQFTPGSGDAAAYRSSKTALNALTVFYAQTLDEEGGKVNALAPGLRATDLNARTASYRTTAPPAGRTTVRDRRKLPMLAA
nr:SDR family oxidoreductase [Streptomyces sp.]